jgi:adenosylcobinamide kinase / adenosylcobinamide-phosphate guanylyltransferase
VRYLAPGPAIAADEAWAHRVAEHRNRRPAHWSTVETDDITGQLRTPPHTPTLIDDLGTWLTGTLDRHQGWDDGPVPGAAHDAIDETLDAMSAFPAPLVLVSPEVGLTVVPATASGRRFADELGILNQRMAGLCHRVVLVVAGQALPVKGREPDGI